MPEDDKKTVAANYWVEVEKEMESFMATLPRLLLVVHNSAEFDNLVRLIRRFPRYGEMVYISLARPFASIREYYVDWKDLTIVDCISHRAFPAKSLQQAQSQTEGENVKCFYEHPPSDLGELKELIYEYVHWFDPHLVVLDSLSQFVDFSIQSTTPDLFEFFNNLKAQYTTQYTKFILLYDEEETGESQALPKYQVDKILRYEVIKSDTNWTANWIG